MHKNGVVQINFHQYSQSWFSRFYFGKRVSTPQTQTAQFQRN